MQREAQPGFVAQLPLAKVDASGRLPLGNAINPAWAARIEALVATAVQPVLGTRDYLTAAEIAKITTTLEPYQTWMAAKPATKTK